MIRKIIFTTLRNNKGATGGPGGVLYLQKTTLGESINGIPCEYHFNKIQIRLGPLRDILNSLVFRILFAKEKDAYFFVHDVGMAALLASMHKPYSLIFHQQGPTVLEAINLGRKPGKLKRKFMEATERKAFVNANTLHFPSKGAADMYFDSKYANCTRDEVNIVDPLYNIIPELNPKKPESLDLYHDENLITLFSLGTLTAAKGQDQTVAFIREYAKVSPKPLRYIMVGRGPMKEQLLKQLDEIKTEVKTFSYIFFESIPHDAVMYLHKICDIYIMLHRISIFDFATLEAMSQHSAVILSKVGGNLDFNMDDNIIFAEDALEDKSILLKADIAELKERNYKVFRKYFSEEAFIKQYEDFFLKVINQ